MSPRTSLLAATLIVAGLALTGCSQSATRDAVTDEVTESGDVSAFEMKVGDCFNDEGTSEMVTEVPAVPCADAHDNEVYYVFDVADGDYDETAIDAAASETCTAEFEKFVGITYDESTLDWFHITPSAETWADGDREIVCSVYGEDKLTGSMKGAAV